MKENRKELLSEKIRRTQEQMEKLKKADMQLKKQLANEKQKDMKAWQAALLRSIAPLLEKRAGKEYWETMTVEEITQALSEKFRGREEE